HRRAADPPEHPAARDSRPSLAQAFRLARHDRLGTQDRPLPVPGRTAIPTILDERRAGGGAMSDTELEAKGVTVAYGGLIAVDKVDLSVASGTIHGLIGPNGAGKSTFLNAVSGLAPLRAGTLSHRGRDITRLRPHQRGALGIARTFQHLQLIEERTVLENVLIGHHLHIGPKTGLKRLWVGSDEPAVARLREIMEVLEFDIEAVMLAPVETLTLYQRRRVEIARALALQPTLLMLDEPGAGLSPASLEALTGLIRKIRNDLNITIILIEHVIALVMNLCDAV